MAVQRDFYTVSLADGTESDVWEKLFRCLEATSSEPLSRAREGDWPLDHDARFQLAGLIAVQFTRGPDVREMINRGFTDLVNLCTFDSRRGFDGSACRRAGRGNTAVA